MGRETAKMMRGRLLQGVCTKLLKAELELNWPRSSYMDWGHGSILKSYPGVLGFLVWVPLAACGPFLILCFAL